MLYGIFTIFMILLSIMGIIHMCVFESYTYIIFPIATFVWGFYKFFKENDDEYRRRNGIKPSMDIGWLFGLDDEEYHNSQYPGYGYYDGSNYNRSSKNNYTQPTTKYNYSNPEYKIILPRCRRNSLVTTDKVKTKQ